jgi:hypothetical protein
MSLLAFVHSRIWAHEVGEPLLEQLPIWSRCCNQHDCIPQQVSILRKEEKTLTVDIAGSQASVDKSKFSPVPSTRTWVCYVIPNGVVTNDNIRCILHPNIPGQFSYSRQSELCRHVARRRPPFKLRALGRVYPIRSNPPIYGLSASGIATLPSFC